MDDISSWIETKAREAGATSLIVGISGGVDSALVAGLCSITSMPVWGVIMPCHSSPDAMVRACEVIHKFKIKNHTIELDEVFACITQKLPDPEKSRVNFCHGALRSCLRAPVLDYVAKLYNGIIVGTGNRDEDEVTRYYQKRGDGAVDISPIAKLHKSQVYDLAREIGVPDSVLNARPSADLWNGTVHDDEDELGMTYHEIEFGIKAAEKFSNGEDVSSTHLEQAAREDYTDRERVVLLKLAEMEKNSRHKANSNIPVLKSIKVMRP